MNKEGSKIREGLINMLSVGDTIICDMDPFRYPMIIFDIDINTIGVKFQNSSSTVKFEIHKTNLSTNSKYELTIDPKHLLKLK